MAENRLIALATETAGFDVAILRPAAILRRAGFVGAVLPDWAVHVADVAAVLVAAAVRDGAVRGGVGDDGLVNEVTLENAEINTVARALRAKVGKDGVDASAKG
jgi:nucleoside-diphosphate-sugar epimerase